MDVNWLSLHIELMRHRILALLLIAVFLPAVSKTDANGYLSLSTDGWAKLDAGALRFRISSDPVIKSALIWDELGERIFPPENEMPHITEEDILSDIKRLDALRVDAPSWDVVAKGAETYYYCTNALCLEIDGPALMDAIGANPADHPILIQADKASGWGWGLVMPALVILAGLGFARHRQKSLVQTLHSTDPDGFPFGAVTINPRQMTAQGEGYVNDLTERDLKLLAFFRDNRGNVLSKDELYDAGWGRDFHPNSRALEQHILTLRRKLDPRKEHGDLIETVHGRGYRYSG